MSLVAYESDNKITNAGKEPWKKETGLLSIWILGMFNPSPSATIVAPIKPGPESELGVEGDVGLLRQHSAGPAGGEGRRDLPQRRRQVPQQDRRSTPSAAKPCSAAYDADNKVLTIVQFSQPPGVTDYVNSLWKLQDNPYGGDAANSYNDGPATPGAKPMGPFFELESSSPAAALAPGQEPVACPPHDSFERAGTRPGCGRARDAWRLSVGDQNSSAKSVRTASLRCFSRRQFLRAGAHFAFQILTGQSVPNEIVPGTRLFDKSTVAQGGQPLN